ncbi:MAG: DUF6361 family protein [Planctomycetota bacterium]
MTSTFGWVDFAEQDREQMLDVVNLFRLRGTRDELGLGTVRAAFSNYLFPGITTIQTRARYFFFVPWVYNSLDGWLQRGRRDREHIARRVRRRETKLILALLGGEDETGIIGRGSRGELQRMPSSIYWAGLQTFGIRLYPGSISQYHRRLSVRSHRHSDGRRTGSILASASHLTPEEGSKLDWRPDLPAPPEDLFNEVSLRLTTEEAEYLRDQIRLSARSSLIAALLIHEPDDLEVPYFWDLPIIQNLPPDLAGTVQHAERFSLVMHGAQLLYNLMLAEKRPQKASQDYRALLLEWAGQIDSMWSELNDWRGDLHRFWGCSAFRQNRIRTRTKTFVERWLDCLFDGTSAAEIIGNGKARSLIANREISLKGWKRARLESDEALARWPGESGTSRLGYRWSTGRAILQDIRRGLERKEESVNA